MVNQSGKVYGDWIVLSFSHRAKTAYYWNCRCNCGTEKPVNRCHLTRGKSTNCGCKRPDTARTNFYKHGQSISRNGRPTGAYESWQGAKDRCFNTNDTKYRDYGGRGISMCDEWINSFQVFHSFMGDRPKGLTLDRINVNGNYEPKNCRWATIFEQANNKRRTKRR
jgi:hypothetical protein